ncbi:hypothetical protein ACFXTN_017500 [Malus domestica]
MTGIATPDASPSTPAAHIPTVMQPALTGQAPKAHPNPLVVTRLKTAPLVEVTTHPPPAEPTISPLVEKMTALEPTVAPALEKLTSVAKKTPSNIPRQSAIILEDDESDEISLESRPRPTNPPPAIEMIGQVDPPTAATAKTPIHPLDQNLGIPPQEAISAYISTLIIVLLITLLPKF